MVFIAACQKTTTYRRHSNAKKDSFSTSRTAMWTVGVAFGSLCFHILVTFESTCYKSISCYGHSSRNEHFQRYFHGHVSHGQTNECAN